MTDVPATSDSLRIGDHTLRSRLFVGTGKYASFEQSCAALEASGAEVVTVAVRRVDFASEDGKRLGRYLTEKKYTILPNTAGCYTTEETVRTARLAREMLGTALLKLEVIGDPRTLFPDVVQTLEATKVLVAEGFTVLAYTTDDPITARKLEDLGCAAVMPLAAPTGAGAGRRNPTTFGCVLGHAKVPLVVAAGGGTGSDAAIAMELGCDAVLMNTAIAGAKDPVLMASAMRKAVEAGREAFRAGRIEKKLYATASSPLRGILGSSRS